ncbi:hypothetical protein [Sorangium sp. So ce1153]
MTRSTTVSTNATGVFVGEEASYFGDNNPMFVMKIALTWLRRSI